MRVLRWMNQSDATRSLARTFRTKAQKLTQVADRRKTGRLKEGWTLSCSLGRVRDLSAGGMRLVSRRRLRGKLELDLWDINRGVRVRAEVVWTKRLGFRRHEVGLKFRDLSPDLVRDLTALGADNRAQLESDSLAA